MPITYGPQAPGWDPVREQERQRERAKIDAAVEAALAAEAADGDPAETIWQDLETATTGLTNWSPLRHGPQNAGWDPGREQEIAAKHFHIQRTVDASQVVAAADGVPAETVWQTFQTALRELVALDAFVLNF